MPLEIINLLLSNNYMDQGRHAYQGRLAFARELTPNDIDRPSRPAGWRPLAEHEAGTR